MEALYIYIAKSSGLIVLFYCAYYFLLRKETFFRSNRWFLLTGLITSILLPFFVYTKIVWIDPIPVTDLNFPEVLLSQTPAEKNFEINWNHIILSIYSIGVLLFLIKLAKDFHHLNSVLKGKKIQQQADYKFIDTTEKIAPFSYFQYIVYNSSMYTTSELENIIEHEKVHSDQNHSADVLISQVFCLLFWFNPIIWFYKKAIVQNLEFIADNEASKKISDKKAYQYTLLKITTHESCVAITNHFYQSLIKKRIVMLNKNQSKKKNSWKYYAILPALTAFMFLFQVQVIAKEKSGTKKSLLNKETTITNKSAQILSNIPSFTEKEIFINGSKATEEEMNKLDPKEIVSMDVTKNSGKTIIKIITKNLTKPLKITDKEIYIDGVKSSKEELSNLNETTIDKVHVNTSENTVRINTKTIQEEKPLIVVNYIVMSQDFNVNNLDASKIISMNVLKGKKATGNYGDDHPYVIQIETTDNTYVPSFNFEKALIIIDGKESDYKSFLKIKAKEVKITNTMNYENTSESNKKFILKKYGEKGRNGVMEVTTIPYDNK